MKKNYSLVVISILIIIISVLITYIVVRDRKTNIDRNSYVASDTLMHITKSETSDSVIYNVLDNAKKLSYSWTFSKGEELTQALKNNMEIDLNLKLDLLTKLDDKNLDDLITNDDSLIVSFEHHGALPVSAKVRIDVSDKYRDGELLYLYYLNENKTQVEYVDNQIPVRNGYVEFEIDHCSKYFLTASIIQEAVNNPKNVNLIIIVMVVVIIVLIGATLMQNKKQFNE